MTATGKVKKRGATRKPAKQKSIFGWLWLVTGLLIGLFVAFLVFLQGQPQQDTIVKKEVVKKPAQEEPLGSETFDYDFYKILPKLEVVTQDDDNADNADKSKKPRPKAVEKPGIYVVQAGSFKKHADADRRKANLALLGVTSKIVTVKMDDGQTWHRVQIGPFENLKLLNETKDLLSKNKIDVLLLRVKG